MHFQAYPHDGRHIVSQVALATPLNARRSSGAATAARSARAATRSDGWTDARLRRHGRFTSNPRSVCVTTNIVVPVRCSRKLICLGFTQGHRIRHYGLLANGSRKASLALARQLLGTPEPQPAAIDDEDAGVKPPTFVCQHCGRALLIVQTFTRGQSIRAPPPVYVP